MQTLAIMDENLKSVQEISVLLYMELRKATVGDINNIMQVFEEARQAQRSAGFRQWEDGYPSIEVLKSDIDHNIGYVLDDNGKTAGYVAIGLNDAEYDRHPELWDVDKTYVVFHRIALSDEYRGKGFSSVLFDLAEAEGRRLGVGSVRIDTGLQNKAMQFILAKRNYTNLQACDFVWGRRLAYEKPLL